MIIKQNQRFMKRLFLLSIVAVFCLVTQLNAQYEFGKNAISAKFLLTDYELPLTKAHLDLSNATRGAEIAWTRHLNDFLNFSLPVKMGIADFPITKNTFRDGDLFVSFDALLQLKYFEPDNLFAPYIFSGIGATFGSDDESFAQVPLGAGLNIRLANHVYLQVQAENRWGLDDLRDHIQYSGGVFVLLGPGIAEAPPADSDGDGIIDAIDKCPNTPGIAAFQGCPDTDGDGIEDSADDCPEEAGSADLNGCPDADGDGIADKDDKCPNEAGVAAFNGCPDTDGDGVADPEDGCPTTPGLVRFNGCPDSDGDGIADKDDDCPNVVGLAALNGCPDTDGDGVKDGIDKCPTSPGPASNDGCPEIKDDVKKKLEFAMRAVQFDTGKSTLKSSSTSVMNEIVAIMNEYSDYSMKISGHTDSVGSSESNQKLSESRAKTCYDFLVANGIASSRLSYAGYGEERPIASNDTRAGQEKNRRTEFEMYIK